MAQRSVVDQFASVARELRTQTTERATLTQAAEIAVEVITGCHVAGVSLVDSHRKVQTVAATDAVAVRGDALQYELDEGPCLDSIREQATVLSCDLRTEGRWPRWSSQAAEELGMRSVLSFPLFTTERSYGALNLYSRTVDGFDHQDQVVGLALAAHAAVALAASRDIDERDLAIGRRTVIGQAQGILMERFDMDEEQAFEVLRRVSSHANRKLYVVAEELVRTRRTPRS